MMYEINVIKKLQDRILLHSMPEPNTGCWLWLGDSVKGGYGRVFDGKRKVLSHRMSYEVFVSPIPDGLTIDHKCKVTCCCNPNHLEPVTMKENTMRGNSFSKVNALKTHCQNGHEYTNENTYLYKKNKRRECVICMKEREKIYYLKNRESIIRKTKDRYYKNK